MVELVFSGTQVTALSNISNGVTESVTRYEYDASNRLIKVIADLSPLDNSMMDIYFARFNADGGSTVGKTRANTTIAGFQSNAVPVALADGGYLPIWEGSEIIAQRYNKSNMKVGGEFVVNQTTTGFQQEPRAVRLADSSVYVVWMSTGQDGSGTGLYGRRLNADGSLSSVETRINLTTTDDQTSPSLTALDDGSLLATWTSKNQDGSDTGIYARSLWPSQTQYEITVPTLTAGNYELQVITKQSGIEQQRAWGEFRVGSNQAEKTTLNMQTTPSINVYTTGTDTSITSWLATQDTSNVHRNRIIYDAADRVTGNIDAEGFLTEIRYTSAGQALYSVRYANRVPAYNSTGTIINLSLLLTGTLSTLRPTYNDKDIYTAHIYNGKGPLQLNDDRRTQQHLWQQTNPSDENGLFSLWPGATKKAVF